MSDGSFSIPLRRPEVTGKTAQSLSFNWILPEFIGGPENRWVESLFVQIEQEHLASLSPLILYGPSGVGKSALLISLIAHWVSTQQTKSVTYTNGSDFTRELTLAIEADNLDEFRRRFRDCSLLVIEDLHELIHKPAAQEELVSTLDSRANAELPFLASLPRLPSSVRGLKPSLLSRLSSGLLVPVEAPGANARRRIMQIFSSQLRLDLSPAWIERIASRLPDGTRVSQLRTTLLRVAHSESSTDESHEQQLESLLSEQQQLVTPSIADIAKAVAKFYQIRLADLRGTTRKSNLVRARSLAMHLARQHTSLSLQQIGRYFSGRDHSTVLHSCRKIELELTEDPDFQRQIQELSQSLVGQSL